MRLRWIDIGDSSDTWSLGDDRSAPALVDAAVRRLRSMMTRDSDEMRVAFTDNNTVTLIVLTDLLEDADVTTDMFCRALNTRLQADVFACVASVTDNETLFRVEHD
jgi:hypothetical protein